MTDNCFRFYGESIEEIRQLKSEGHKYIDKLVELGFSREAVYRHLQVKLKTNYGNHHFGKMNTLYQLKRAVKHLRKWYTYEHERLSMEVYLPQKEINRLIKNQ